MVIDWSHMKCFHDICVSTSRQQRTTRTEQSFILKVILPYINIITRLTVHPGTEATKPTIHNNLIYFNSEITSRVQVLNKACGHVFKYKQGSVRTRKWVTFQQLFLNLIFRTISLRLFGFFDLFVWAFLLVCDLKPCFLFCKVQRIQRYLLRKRCIDRNYSINQKRYNKCGNIFNGSFSCHRKSKCDEKLTYFAHPAP